MYKQGTTFTVLAKAPGGEWFYVQAPENIAGWVFGFLLQTDHDLQAAPVIQPENVQLINLHLQQVQVCADAPS